MGSDDDGDDLTAGQTNKAQSGTELVVDQTELGGGNDYILQVRHETSSPRVGAIRGRAGLFGVSGEGATTGVIGMGGQIGVEGQSASIALKGSGGAVGLLAQGSSVGALAFTAPFNTTGFGMLAIGQVGVGGDSPGGVGGAGVRGTGDTGVLAVGTMTGVVGTAPEGPSVSVSTGVFGTGHFGVHARSVSGVGLVAQGPNSLPGAAAIFEGHVAVIGSFVVYGPKSAAVPHADGSHRLLYSLECPESWFEDFGEGELVNGKAEVRLDPDFSAVVRAKKYHVFVTPCGDSHGLYVTKKTNKGFEVSEQQGGKGKVKFSYRVVAKRKDIKGERLKKISLPVAPPKPPQMPKIALPKEVAGLTAEFGSSTQAQKSPLKRS